MALITGKVVDDAGRPVAGARVYFTRSPVPMPDTALVTSDDGTFTLAVPEHGQYEITSSTDEHQASAAVDVNGERHQVELRVG